MKRVLFGILFVLTFLISAISHVPAHVVLGFIPLPPDIKLDGLSGTIWNGSAASFQWENRSLGSLAWEFNFLRLFTGKLDLSLRLLGVPGLLADGNLGYGFGGIYAKDFRLSAPVNRVSDFIPTPIPVSLSGNVDVSVLNYQMNKPLCTALKGNVTWSQAQVITPVGTVNAGSVEATLSCKSGSVLIKGSSQSDAVGSEFNVSLAPNQRVVLDAFITPGATLPESLKSQLKWLGEPDSKGRYKLNYKG